MSQTEDVSTVVLTKWIETRLQEAIQAVFPDVDLRLIRLQICTNAAFGDYQCTSVMAIAKRLKLNPRKAAEEVLGHLDISEVAHDPELAG
ncbi:MAG: hypothetical protein ACPHDL_02515, partial [Limisphaerales bacterium]